jgi:putative endonuclease
MAGRGDFSNMAFYVYILRLSNSQLYVGSTEDLARRFAEHQAGSGGKTTALFQPLELVYSEPHPDRASAVKRERQLKRWSRAKKLALIKGNSAELKRLSDCIPGVVGRATQPAVMQYRLNNAMLCGMLKAWDNLPSLTDSKRPSRSMFARP